MAPCSGYRLLLKGVNDPDRERGAQSHAEPDTEQGHERRLYEESEPHLFPLEAKRPEHTDLLPSFDHGAGRDDAEGSDAYQEAQTHETHEQVVEESLRGRTVFDLFLYRDGLKAVLGEGFLQVFRDGLRIHPTRQEEIRTTANVSTMPRQNAMITFSGRSHPLPQRRVLSRRRRSDRFRTCRDRSGRASCPRKW